MKLNTIKPAEGSKKDTRRVGRGTGSGFANSPVLTVALYCFVIDLNPLLGSLL